MKKFKELLKEISPGFGAAIAAADKSTFKEDFSKKERREWEKALKNTASFIDIKQTHRLVYEAKSSDKKTILSVMATKVKKGKKGIYKIIGDIRQKNKVQMKINMKSKPFIEGDIKILKVFIDDFFEDHFPNLEEL